MLVTQLGRVILCIEWQNLHEAVDVIALGGDQYAALVVVSGVVERFAVESRPVRELAVGVGDGLLRPERVHAALARVANHRKGLPNNTSMEGMCACEILQ